MVAPTGFDDFVTGGAKAESPPVIVFLDFNRAADPLFARPEAGAGDVVAAQKHLPYHAIVPDDGDGFERMEWEVLVIADADVGHRRLLVDGVVLLSFHRNELLLDDEFQPLVQRRRDGAGRVDLRPPEQ
ncbi:hypothetical protein CRG98_017331 [Punica granatum]|uniref:Uncharacterized protein n=1 Tax=Punica granatum TaxID=22663 RepID=A0A2I0K2G8_PUNGR|nr:hypothetical protein CRG98_017331 [Punica granatum]